MVINMKRIKIYKTGFTLLELLAVLFIIGIIFSIALPAFGPMMNISRLKTSAQNLAGTMETARQYAVTMEEECYIVFPTSTGTDLDNKTYKVYNPDTGRTIGKLEFLPKGIEIDINNSTVRGSVDIPFPEDTDSPKSLKYIRFKTNGGILPGDTGANGHIRLYEKTTNKYQQVYFYNTPRRVNIKPIGE